MPQNLANELNSLDFGTLIGGPLQAAVNAQHAAASVKFKRTTVVKHQRSHCLHRQGRRDADNSASINRRNLKLIES